MSITTEVTCDQCGADLTATGNCEDWRLVLTYEGKQIRGGMVTAMAISPPVDRTYHFCGLKCLDAWRDAARDKAAKQEAWRKANRMQVAEGITTCPPLPDELK